MNKAVPTILKSGYRCSEAICEERVHTICLIKSSSNSAEAKTKLKPNKTLLASLQTNVLHAPPKRVLVLQTSRFFVFVIFRLFLDPQHPCQSTNTKVATLSQVEILLKFRTTEKRL